MRIQKWDTTYPISFLTIVVHPILLTALMSANRSSRSFVPVGEMYTPMSPPGATYFTIGR